MARIPRILITGDPTVYHIEIRDRHLLLIF